MDTEPYYRAATTGGLVCIRSEDPISGPHFRFMRIREIGNGRIHTGYVAFWAAPARSDQRNGGGRYCLVVPTLDLVALGAARAVPSYV